MNQKLTFLLTFIVFFIGLTTTVVCQDLSEGLLGYWPMDEGEGTTTVDRGDTESDGTLMNDPTWIEGMFESALEFDGIDDYVDCGNNDLLEFGPGDFTISAWFKTGGPVPEADRLPTTTSDHLSIFAKGGDDGGGERYHLCIENSTIKIILDDNENNDPTGLGKKDPEGNIAVIDDVWHHVVAYREGLTLRVYVDGNEDTGVTTHSDAALPDGYSIVNTVHPAYIGVITSNNEGFPLNKFFHGILDDVGLWNRVLTTDEIAFLWNDGAGNPVLPKVSSSSDMVLGEFMLHQNYPNPFNSLTTFSFQLTENSHTILKVYDVLGQEVAVLLDGMKSAGTYKEQFDGSVLPEGVYFARLQAGLFSGTIKILLTK